MARYRMDDDDDDDDTDGANNYESHQSITAYQRERSGHQQPICIYYEHSHPPEHDGCSNCCSKYYRWIVIAVFLIIYGCLYHLPPSPPPAVLDVGSSSQQSYNNATIAPRYSCWADYTQEHREKLATASKALFVDTPWYLISSWTWSFATFVWTSTTSRVGEPIFTARRRPDAQPICSWRYSSEASLYARLEQMIYGQSLAVNTLASAVRKWHVATTVSQVASSTTSSSVLVVVAWGHLSTGKRTLARTLASVLLNDRSDTEEDTHLAASCGTVLEIAGWEYVSPAQYADLWQRIQQHYPLQIKGGGRPPIMLLWSNVDQSDPQLVAKFLAACSTLLPPQSIVYLTTTQGPGMKAIADYMRSSPLGSTTLQQQLSERLHQQPLAFLPATTEHHHIVHLPFLPHTPSTLQTLLAQYDSRLSWTRMALEEVVNPVEYLHWTTTTSSSSNHHRPGEYWLAVKGAKSLPWAALQRLLDDEGVTMLYGGTEAESITACRDGTHRCSSVEKLLALEKEEQEARAAWDGDQTN